MLKSYNHIGAAAFIKKYQKSSLVNGVEYYMKSNSSMWNYFDKAEYANRFNSDLRVLYDIPQNLNFLDSKPLIIHYDKHKNSLNSNNSNNILIGDKLKPMHLINNDSTKVKNCTELPYVAKISTENEPKSITNGQGYLGHKIRKKHGFSEDLENKVKYDLYNNDNHSENTRAKMPKSFVKQITNPLQDKEVNEKDNMEVDKDKAKEEILNLNKTTKIQLQSVQDIIDRLKQQKSFLTNSSVKRQSGENTNTNESNSNEEVYK
jgi:hypothetical protein